MDKSRKLRRYGRKDYTQVVDFPVEIVGRDGVVRRYSFEASVRLYQRRIASASGRYGDREVVSAEVEHCRSRIGQLRRSYFRHYGFSDLGRAPESIGELAGEVSAFLRRCFHEQAHALELHPLDEQTHGPCWYVEPPKSEVGYLLYLYRFEHYGTCEGREAFFSLLSVLRAAQGPQVEALVAFHHSGDCGLVMTCQGVHAELPLGEQGEPLEESTDSGPWSEGLRCLSEEDLGAALVHFEAAQLQNPYARRIGVACGTVADLLGEFHVAESAARVGLNAAPHDPALRYQLGLALLRQGQLSLALEQLEQATGHARLPQVPLLLGLLALRQGRLRRAELLLRGLHKGSRLIELEAWIAGVRSRMHLLAVLGGVALGGLLAALASLIWLNPALAALCLLAPALSVVVSAVLVLALARHCSRARLRSLRLPPAEAIGSTGHLGTDDSH